MERRGNNLAASTQVGEVGEVGKVQELVELPTVDQPANGKRDASSRHAPHRRRSPRPRRRGRRPVWMGFVLPHAVTS